MKGWDPLLLFPRGVWTAITIQPSCGAHDHKPACFHHIPVHAGAGSLTGPRRRRHKRSRLDASQDDKDDDDDQHKSETATAIVTGSVERATAQTAEAAEQRED